jgi:response regulator RpfG family c-di-GMP phosphodiesterase
MRTVEYPMETAQRIDRQMKSVLLVEDDPRISSLLGATLSCSFVVEFASSMEEALALLSGGREFDLVLSDHGLPGGSGLELLAHLRLRSPKTRRVMLTGERDPAVFTSAREECDVHGLLEKPCDASVVLTTCEEVLDAYDIERAQEVRVAELAFTRTALVSLNELLESRLSEREGSLSGLQRYALDLAAATNADEIGRLTERALSGLLGGRRVRIELEAREHIHSDDSMSHDLVDAEGRLHGVLTIHRRDPADTLDAGEQAQVMAVSSTLSVALGNEARRVERDRAQQSAILALARLAEKRDDDTGQHLERVSHYSRLLAEGLRRRKLHPELITDAWIEDLVRSAPLHDIGKVAIPDSILKKPGPLTSAEREVMKTHTTIGAATLQAAHVEGDARGFLEMGRDIALNHHERWDGEGYPSGIAAEEIPLAARILSLADVYDALTTRRPYKEAWTHAEATAWISERGGTQFDPDLVAVFCAQASDFDSVRGKLADRDTSAEIG